MKKTSINESEDNLDEKNDPGKYKIINIENERVLEKLLMKILSRSRNLTDVTKELSKKVNIFGHKIGGDRRSKQAQTSYLLFFICSFF
jgi:hypothetical protein